MNAVSLEQGLFIRRFEELLVDLYQHGHIAGTIHTCIGQELTAVCLAPHLDNDDWVFSNHRCHGHYLALRRNPLGLLKEILGRDGGLCEGVGGSQHLHDVNFFSNGIQGGMTPVAAGTALAEKGCGNGHISVAFTGDGTFGEGIVYEVLNIISKWELPLLWVVENNQIAQSTPLACNMAGTIENRVRAFEAAFFHGDAADPDALERVFAESVKWVRTQSKPAVVEVTTSRMGPHSKGDDTRSSAELDEIKRNDPLTVALDKMSEAMHTALFSRVDERIQSLREAALAAPLARRLPNAMTKVDPQPLNWQRCSYRSDKKRFNELLYDVFRQAMTLDASLMMLGEDVEAPYGGAFKVTRDLSALFPGRVRNTPISEAAIAGIAAGVALKGRRVVAEIMFGDFVTLCMDQLVNHIGKFALMYGHPVRCPLILRTPMGGRRGYGPTHSQSLERLIIGIPGVDVIALCPRIAPDEIYASLLNHAANPTIVIENKVLYTQQLRTTEIPGFSVTVTDECFPTLRISPDGQPDITILCYGEMLNFVEKAIEVVFDEYDLLCEVICPTRLSPVDIRPLVASIRASRRLLTVEEGCAIGGLGSICIAQLVSKGIPLKTARCLGNNGIVPTAAHLERQVIPGVDEIVNCIKELTTDV